MFWQSPLSLVPLFHALGSHEIDLWNVIDLGHVIVSKRWKFCVCCNNDLTLRNPAFQLPGKVRLLQHCFS